MKRALKVYLAARYTEKHRMRHYRTWLERDGVEVVSRWLDEPDSNRGGMRRLPEEVLVGYAKADLEDVSKCEVLVVFTEEPVTPFVRGGRFVEVGWALAKGKRVMVCGPRQNIFLHLPAPAVMVYTTWAEARKVLVAEAEGRRW